MQAAWQYCHGLRVAAVKTLQWLLLAFAAMPIFLPRALRRLLVQGPEPGENCCCHDERLEISCGWPSQLDHAS